MEYIEGLPSFKITYCQRIKHNQDLLSGYADSDWGNSLSRRSTSGNLMLYNQAPIMWRSKMQKTTALCPRQRRSTTQHRRPEVTCYTSASSLTNLASPSSHLHQCMKTTQRASNGETTSSEDGNAPSTLTSGSTSPTKSSRMAKCGLVRSLPHPSWRTSSRRAYTTSSARRASRASSLIPQPEGQIHLRDPDPQEGMDRQGLQVE